jgi:2'-5' RNA ligase
LIKNQKNDTILTLIIQKFMTKRVFIAINLPDEIKKKIGLVIGKLKKINPDYKIKWVAPENLHLTLHFFGDLNEKQIAQAGGGIEKIIKQIDSFEMKTGEFGCFPNEKHPRVIFIEVKDSQVIHLLIGQLEVMLQNLGFPVDTRPWQAHLTLGRIKDNTKCKTASIELAPEIFNVKSVELMESRLTPEGSVYSVIKSFPLK